MTKKQSLLALASSILLGIVIGGTPFLGERSPSLMDQCCPMPVVGDPLDQPIPDKSQGRYSKARKRPVPLASADPNLTANVPPPPTQEGYRSIGFEKLSQFVYELKADGTVENLPNGKKPTIPGEILQLDGQQIALSGFLIPLTFEAKSQLFLLTRNQMLCCYGQTPKVNEWAVVRMKTPVTPILEKPVAVFGRIRVGEVVEEGVVICLYQLEGERIQPLER